jgi:peptide subunit release factor RF-3
METHKKHDRAQPGDVVGIENEGKRTHLGDSRKDENDRVREARDEANKQPSDKKR